MASPHIFDTNSSCSAPACDRLVFTPCQCKYCKHWFCFPHLNADIHNCKEYVPRRPDSLYRPAVFVSYANAAELDAPRANNLIDPTSSPSNSSDPSQVCSRDDCGVKLPCPIFCERCDKHFCTKHWLYISHKCSGSTIGMSKTGTTPPQQLRTTLPTSKPYSLELKSMAPARRSVASVQPFDMKTSVVPDEEEMEEQSQACGPLNLVQTWKQFSTCVMKCIAG